MSDACSHKPSVNCHLRAYNNTRNNQVKYMIVHPNGPMLSSIFVEGCITKQRCRIGRKQSEERVAQFRGVIIYHKI
jgi:hypothetical protein